MRIIRMPLTWALDPPGSPARGPGYRPRWGREISHDTLGRPPWARFDDCSAHANTTAPRGPLAAANLTPFPREGILRTILSIKNTQLVPGAAADRMRRRFAPGNGTRQNQKTMHAPAATTTVTETKIVMSDPTALGVFGLSMVTFVAASAKMHWTSGTAYIIPWALFLGSVAQIWASTIDFKKNNYFGAIVLGVYGLFWVAVSMHWAMKLGWFGALGANADPRQFGYACFGYTIFSLFIMVAAFEANKVFAAILVLINILLPSLGFSLLGVQPDLFNKLAAWSELLISLLGFYAAGAVFLNSYFGRVLLPLGKPLGLIRKGPALKA